jgi:hypothetical protein
VLIQSRLSLLGRTAAVGLLAAALGTVTLGAAAPAHAATVGQASTPTKAQYAPKGAPATPGARVQRAVSPAATTFMYGAGYQYGAADGLFGNLGVARPFLASSDSHSLAELAAESSDGKQIVEVGWTVDRGLNGDANPHLFVYHWVDGVGSCYNGCGFVQRSSSVRPGLTLTLGTAPFFAIQHFQGNWWVAYGNEWVGYFPDALWGGRYTAVGLSEWFGEVAAGSLAPCTDMGTSAFASHTSAATITGMGFYGGPTVGISTFSTHPAYYTAATTSSSSMRYGGPGAC